MGRLLIVSADGHITMPAEAVKTYLPTNYQSWYKSHLEDVEEFRTKLWFLKFPPEALEIIDTEHRIRDGGDVPWDYDKRIAEMDREGIAAEALLPQDISAPVPFFDPADRPYPADVRQAGVTAYHRYVADVIARAPSRLFGVAAPGPCLDMDATVRELHWVAEHGFRSVSVPGYNADPALPPLSSRYYEPFWAACNDLGLVLSVHAGHGRLQGAFMEYMSRLIDTVGKDASHQELQTTHKAGLVPGSPFYPDTIPHKALWNLMVGGVFDRYPNLMLAF